MTHDQWAQLSRAERIVERNEWKDSAKLPKYFTAQDKAQTQAARNEAKKNLKLYTLNEPRPWTHYGRSYNNE